MLYAVGGDCHVRLFVQGLSWRAGGEVPAGPRSSADPGGWGGRGRAESGWGTQAWAGRLGAPERLRRDCPGRAGETPASGPAAPGRMGGAGQRPEKRLGESGPRSSRTHPRAALRLLGTRLSPGTSPRVTQQHGPFTSGTRPCARS